ncbi:fibronectin type III domain-containing protein [Mesonia sediminis]|uniref:Fibronectin type III domain-containing protein n=1 Tax=Mesonia sediminis TaxID=1703946 RepID=A0ABW5SHH4_9FLAO
MIIKFKFHYNFITKKICLLIFITLLISCSNDDHVEISSLQADDFNISISEITDNSVKISWSISENGLANGVESDDISYDLYLNDTLIIENSNVNEYTLNNLESFTTYNGKVIAKINPYNQAELTFEFQTIQSPQSYLPFQVGNIWYYTKIYNYPLDYRTYKIKKEIVSSQTINNKLNYLIEETELYYKWERYYEGHEDYEYAYPCSTVINSYFLRFENGKIIKTEDSNEVTIIDFNETSYSDNNSQVEIIEECNINFYSINSCIYKRLYFSLGYNLRQTYMEDVGMIKRESLDQNSFGTVINLIGYKPSESLIIGEEHDFECD